MADNELHSLSKGVFVIPFRPESEAGPSRPHRPLRKVYDATYDHVSQAYSEYEKERTDSQLDDIADWVDRSNAPPLLKKTVSVIRLPVAIIQNISESLSPFLNTVLPRVHTLLARDATDLSAAVRNIAIGFIGDPALNARSSGRTGMDEVEAWYAKQKDRSPLLLHIEQAQSIPPTVLSELIYILAIHPNVPVRVLLSISSASTFLTSFSHVEPSLIDICVIQAGRGRKRGGAVNAILKAGSDVQSTPLTISDELAEELRTMQDTTGGGPAATLKALKWSILHHNLNSPLASISDTPGNAERFRALIKAIRENMDGDVPGKQLLEIGHHKDLSSTHDAAPRISILHALSQPSAFIPPNALEGNGPSTPKANQQHTKTSKSNMSARKPSRGKERTPAPAPEISKESEGGDMKELETLFNLWKSAGRNVNLWDWLQGFRASMSDSQGPESENAETGSRDQQEDGEEEVRPAKRKRDDDDGTEHDERDETKDAVDEDRQDKLHASFIRFCEEARMMGLVRARGRGRRADEVVKGIGLV